MDTDIANLNREFSKGSVALSHSAYQTVRKRLWNVYWRRLVRALKRHAFLLIAGFLFANFFLGELPGLIKVSGNTIVNGLILFLGALGIWAVDRWLLSPHIDRWLDKSLQTYLEANLRDLLNAFLFARMCRVFASSILYEMLDKSNKQYEEAVKSLTQEYGGSQEKYRSDSN
jgi:hypothetical protein